MNTRVAGQTRLAPTAGNELNGSHSLGVPGLLPMVADDFSCARPYTMIDLRVPLAELTMRMARAEIEAAPVPLVAYH